MILLAFAFAETLLVKVPVMFEMPGVDDGADGADPAVGVVEEAGDESSFEDLVIVETDIASLHKGKVMADKSGNTLSFLITFR